ncbi:MAG: hypothetical protein MRZ79_06865, partial [Bacteroidia bacterium]|nr:hypothetical protein [Bacteroidia bacterium]
LLVPPCLITLCAFTADRRSAYPFERSEGGLFGYGLPSEARLGLLRIDLFFLNIFPPTAF